MKEPDGIEDPQQNPVGLQRLLKGDVFRRRPDEEDRMVDHDEVLGRSFVVGLAEITFALDAKQLDGHSTSIAVMVALDTA